MDGNTPLPTAFKMAVSNIKYMNTSLESFVFMFIISGNDELVISFEWSEISLELE